MLVAMVLVLHGIAHHLVHLLIAMVFGACVLVAFQPQDAGLRLVVANALPPCVHTDAANGGINVRTHEAVLNVCELTFNDFIAVTGLPSRGQLMDAQEPKRGPGLTTMPHFAAATSASTGGFVNFSEHGQLREPLPLSTMFAPPPPQHMTNLSGWRLATPNHGLMPLLLLLLIVSLFATTQLVVQ
jgi:hypothetical protein